jgi:hypothetical protein
MTLGSAGKFLLQHLHCIPARPSSTGTHCIHAAALHCFFKPV